MKIKLDKIKLDYGAFPLERAHGPRGDAGFGSTGV